MAESDEQIVARVLAGDTGAYRALVDRHGRGLHRLGYRMMANAEDAEDVVQETFLRAFRQIRSFQQESTVRTWLYRIAANYCLDLIRSRKKVAPWPSAPAREWEPAEDRPLPDRLAEMQMFQRRLASAMEELTAQERAAFVLRHCEGQSIEAIAEALGVNSNAAKHSVFRAVRKLRVSLAPLMGVLA